MSTLAAFAAHTIFAPAATSRLPQRLPLAKRARPALAACSLSSRALVMTSSQSISSSPSQQIPAKPSTLICTSLTASTIDGQIEQAHKASSAGADLIEIRVDLLDRSEALRWSEILASSPLPVIVTNRAAWEGGNSYESEPERLAVLLDAISLRAAHIDVELAAFPTFKSLLDSRGLSLPLPDTRLILSHHNFDRALTFDELVAIQAEMASYADIAKIAMTATSALDNLLVIDTLRNANMPTILLAMGELGQLSRIVGPKFGAYLTFASIERGKESAPGQVDTGTLTEMYRFRDITPETPLYGVIGNPVSHSKSPALHNDALVSTGTAGVYLPLLVESSYPEFIRGMASRGFQGFSVTIPGKVAAMDAMDAIDEVAQKIGAINTVVVQPNGTLKGYNTDWSAAITAIEEKVIGGLQGRRVVCLGAGGAGRALAFGALERGAELVIVVNRTLEKAMALANELGERATAMSLDEFNQGSVSYDVLMNSTSVGMHPDAGTSPVHPEALNHGAAVFDAIYNPLRTRLIQDAEKKGCNTVSGLEMFVRQAAEQFRLWFPNVDAPIERMKDVVIKTLP